MIDEKGFLQLLKEPAHKSEVDRCRTLQSNFKRHITGEGYDSIITRLQGIESITDMSLRKQLSQPATIEITSIILDELNRWENAHGTHKQYLFKSKGREDEFKQVLSQVWKGQPIEVLVKDFLKRALDTEFNGFLVVTKPAVQDGMVIGDGIIKPYDGGDLNPYIIFVSINDVVDFDINGSKVQYLLWKVSADPKNGDIYRALNDRQDILIQTKHQEIDGQVISVVEHGLTYVPAVQISIFQKDITVEEVKTTQIDHLLPALDRYLDKDSMLTKLEVLHNFPKFAVVGLKCKACDGSGVVAGNESNEYQDKKCPTCKGSGKVSPFDTESVLFIPQAISDDVQPYPGAPGTYIAPDVESLVYAKDRLAQMKKDIIFAGTGNKELTEDGLQRTATESVINHKSLEDRIGERVDNIEAVETFLTDAIGRMHNSFKGSYIGSQIRYGRRLNLRDEDAIITEIKDAKDTGMPESHIESLQKELIISKYRNSASELERQLLLADVEPYCGYTLKEVRDMVDYLDYDLIRLKAQFNELIDELEQSRPITEQYKNRENKAMLIRADLLKLLKAKDAERVEQAPEKTEINQQI